MLCGGGLLGGGGCWLVGSTRNILEHYCSLCWKHSLKRSILLFFCFLLNFCKFSLLDKGPEDSEYTVDVLTRCTSNKEAGAKTAAKIVPINDPGEPVVISIPLSQVIISAFFFFSFPNYSFWVLTCYKFILLLIKAFFCLYKD